MVSINKIPTVNHFKSLERIVLRVKYEIPKECIIGDTFFTPLSIIGENLFTRHPKNINHVHKYNKDLLSVIIYLETDVNSD